MTFRGFLADIDKLDGELEAPDGRADHHSLQIAFDKIPLLEELAAKHDMVVETVNRYACTVATRRTAKSSVEVTVVPPAAHIAIVYANGLTGLEAAIRQTSKDPQAKLEELIDGYGDTNRQMQTKTIVYLGHILPKLLLEEDFGTVPTPKDAFSEILATLLGDVGVGKDAISEGLNSISVGRVQTILRLVPMMTTARLLLAEPTTVVPAQK